ncbi:MAG: hypothetical protein FWC36_09440 [Spirochaetes bacterium]|nr:hypothetical protein [Spirochaetota bacterium]
MVVNVEVLHDRALNLLSEMEHLNLIRLNISPKSTIAAEQKLSEQFAGALQLSGAKYEALQNTLQKDRKEWAQDIY